ncbi:hypothetical protein SIN8267_02038 [Sinobacterium norvegicum]|uniref:Acyl-coenzyme A thioesterase THEM4 n=1 Tax=Sinobacterium norvegicum TaxID=1641715 RepID=A0ABM9AFW2_9GAMM|nr:PaaI family thioesterase [Sinobacterium norvegicum]CAH0991923.1 hypothetical protein SIN8267_02038 [Sinobacterium norvegicum]
MNEKYYPFDHEDLRPPIDDHWAAKRRLADATRQLINASVTCTGGTAELNAIAEAIEGQAAQLAALPRLYSRTSFEAAGGHGDMGAIAYELNPLDGKSNPLAAPIMVWMDDNGVYGSVTMGWQYEGPPNSVHGGFVAALFDQFLGVGQKITGQPGMTGTLTVKYHKPTPLNTELTFTGKVIKVDGRKNTLGAEIWANGELTASCEGIFISINRDTYLRMKRMQESRTEG